MIKTDVFNPIEQIENLFKVEGIEEPVHFQHIKYDKKMNEDFDYQIIRQVTHDGTLLFRIQVIADVLKPLVRMESYYQPDLTEDDIKRLAAIEYTVGDIEFESDFGMKIIRDRLMHGETDTVRIPVRCRYTFKEEV